MSLKLILGLSLAGCLFVVNFANAAPTLDKSNAKWLEKSEGKCYRMNMRTSGPNHDIRATLQVDGRDRVKVLEFSSSIPNYSADNLRHTTINALYQSIRAYLQYPDMHGCESTFVYNKRGIPKSWRYFCDGSLQSRLDLSEVKFFTSKDPEMSCPR
jgi:hypothetical protein